MAERVSIVLASGSAARRRLLASAGVAFDVVPSDIDEAAVRRTNRAASPKTIAMILAREKAAGVSAAHPRPLVVGGDQILACDGEIFAKAATLDESRRVLSGLRGRSHELHSAVALAQGGTVVWECAGEAHMTMRDFSEEFLETYLALEGGGVLSPVGCYKFEGRGAQLFDRVDGDHSTILGMPLLPLLAELRRRGALPS